MDRLPAPSEDKDYQLWAIVDGTPMDAGIFQVEHDFTYRVLESVENPLAFAVTLENKGGVPAPTLDEMYLLGQHAN